MSTSSRPSTAAGVDSIVPWRPTTADREHAEELKNMAWAFDRQIRNDNGPDVGGPLGRMMKAADLMKDASEYEVGDTARAHVMLCEAIRDDLKRCGFTFEGAVDLLYKAYSFLDECLEMRFERGRWTGPDVAIRKVKEDAIAARRARVS